MKWGDNKTLKFIRLYESHACLWDISSPDYSVRSKRDAALNAMLAKLNIPNFTRADCKLKIKNIRSQYCYELKRIRQSMKKGGKVYKPTLGWFNAIDRFLRRIVVQRTQSLIKEDLPLLGQIIPAGQMSDAAELEFVDYTTDYTDDVADEELILKSEDCLQDDPESENTYEGNAEPRTAPYHNVVESTSNSYQTAYSYAPEAEERRKVNETLNLLTKTINKLENSIKRNVPTPSREFDVFGQSVAAQLSNMPLEDALQLQMDIQQLITTKRISSFSRAQQ